MKRLPVNLATKPIEQRQWLRRVTVIAAAIVAVITAAQLLLVVTLGEIPDTSAADADAVALLRQWSDEVNELASAVDPQLARDQAISVGLANALIEQRVFPWASLFTVLEESLPDDVRLEVVQPVATLEGVRVTLSAASASGEALLAFLAALEESPDFLTVYPGRQSFGADGDLRLSIEALARIDSREPQR